MKNSFSVWRPAALIFLAASITFPAAAALQLVSTLKPSLGAPANGNGDSWAPLISPDGRYILFASTANNLALVGNSNAIPFLIPPSVNVYLRDRLNGTTALVSVNLAGTGGGNGNSSPTALSTNGQYALFESASSDLVANDTNNANDVFLRDVVNGVTWLVSITPGGMSGNGVSRGSTLTPDGRYVAFASAASNLVANDANGIPDVFVRNWQAGTTVLASTGATSASSGSSEAPEITPDGRYVAFYSTATGLVPGVSTTGEIYVRDLQTRTTTWASTNARTISAIGASGYCYNHAISDNGQFVAFEISSSSTSATNGFILRYNRQNGLTDTIFTNAVLPMGANHDKRSLNLTPDGRFIVFTANNGGVYLWDSQTATNILASGNLTNGIASGTSVYWPDVDPSGRYVVFYSSDTNLTTNASAGLFVRDMQAGTTTTLVSVDTNGFNLAVDPSAAPALSANGGSVAFESPYANLDGRNFECDVFVRDLTTNAAELISAHDPNLASATPNGFSMLFPGSVSTNGQFVAFSSWANNLAANDTNRCLDVFVRDLVAGTNVLVSAATNGFAANDLSTQPAISGDGRYVAFASIANNLVAGDNNLAWDVFVRDLQSGTNSLVSVSTTGGFGNNDSDSPAISTDGRFVLFCSKAQNLAAGSYVSTNLFLRDRQLGQTYGLTTTSFAAYSMTPDGRFVAFAGSIGGSANLYVWNSLTAARIYTNTSSSLTNVSISPDGHWVAYVTGNSLRAADLIAGTNCLIGSGPFNPRAGLKFSGDGRFLAYATSAAQVAGDTNGTSDIYLYDFQSGTNLLVSRSFYFIGAANGAADSPALSADGRFVAYRSYANNCVPGDSNGVPDLFLYDRLTAATILLSVNQSGAATAGNRSRTPVFSGDGQTLVFQSWASDLTGQDFNLGSDLFALGLSDFLSGTNQTNSLSAFQAEIILVGTPSPASGQSPVIAWPFTPGTSAYGVQFKDDLSDPVWHGLNGNLTVLGGRAYVNDLAPSASQRFYRIVLNN